MKMTSANITGSLTNSIARATGAVALLALAHVCAADDAVAPEIPAPLSNPAIPAVPGEQPGGEGASAETAAQPKPLTVEQIRAGMEEAQKRRAALMKPDPAVADSVTHQELLDKWGVEVYGVRLAARAYMIDFRFRVVDADKALPLFDPKTQPYLLTEGTNIKLPVPVGEKVGAFRTTNRGKNITAGRDYYMMFANPDSYVNPGQKVSVVIGEFRAEHMTLQ
jgi:hypothetical protein